MNGATECAVLSHFLTGRGVSWPLPEKNFTARKSLWKIAPATDPVPSRRNARETGFFLQDRSTHVAFDVADQFAFAVHHHARASLFEIEAGAIQAGVLAGAAFA